MFAFLMNNFDLIGSLQSKTFIISNVDCGWSFNDLILYLSSGFEWTDVL